MHESLGSLDARGPLCACHWRKQAAVRLTRLSHAQRCRQKSLRVRAADNDEQDRKPDKDSRKAKKTKTTTLDDFNPVKLGRRSRAAVNQLLAVAEKADRSKQSNAAVQDGTKEDPGIGAVNPIKLGRKSRAVLDNLWEQFASITSPTRSIPVTTKYSSAGEGLTEFETPQAAFTTVLVVGATGRIGRVLTRKLLLRGYKVKAMLRPRLTEDGEIDLERPAGIPQSVEIVYGDVSEYASCRAAAEGVDKVQTSSATLCGNSHEKSISATEVSLNLQVVWAAKSNSTYNVELKKVEEQGPFNMAKAIMVWVFAFGSALFLHGPKTCFAKLEIFITLPATCSTAYAWLVWYRMSKISRHRHKTCCQLVQSAALQILAMTLTTQPGR